jgi:hypothetical protein
MLVVVGGAVTCDNPTGPKPAFINVVPRLDIVSIHDFAGMAVDGVRLIVTRQTTGDTVADKTFPFSVDSAQIDVSLPVAVIGTEQLNVTIQLLTGSILVFTGSTTVSATAGASSPPATPVTVTYQGPGAGIASIQITPRDSGAGFDASVPFRVTALDSSNNPITSYYIGWHAGRGPGVGTENGINANGVFHAGRARGTVWVSAHTPTGIWDSTRITVTPTASAVQVVSGGGQSGSTGTQLSQPLVVKVLASDNLPVVGAQVTFTAPTGGSVSPASAATDSLGFAQTTATLGSGVGNETFSASVSGAGSASFTMNAFAGGASKIVFTTQPASTTAGIAIPNVIASVEDGGNNIVPAFNGNITIAIGTNPGSASLLGTLTVAASNGVATFSGLKINVAASGYTLTASGASLSGGTSSAFNINAGPAVSLSKKSGDNQVALGNDTTPTRPTVKVADSLGNGVSGVAVQFAVATGGGSISSANATTNAQGVAALAGTTGWKLGATPGNNTLTASVPSIAALGSVAFTATGTTVGVVTVSPHLDTMTALGDTFALIGQNHNNLGQPIAGVFSWVSRTPATATVDSLGRVNSIANGSTYIVATEQAGGKDSALIVVQQRIATVSVTPGSRNIYLTRNFNFTAAAVDGRGHTVPGTPTFVWSSTAPSVATVDTVGHVVAVGLGSAQIRAAVGTVIGVSNISVITPITRIAVVFDTVGSIKTDTFTMTSLGLSRRYRAIAHDTLDAVMSGLTFTWASSNGSVAVMNSTTGDTASATSAANGLTQVNATAQGFTSNPGASLTVAQVLASIVLSPPTNNPSANVSVGGTLAMTARGKDANNRFIAGGTFAFASDTVSVATVNAATGVVTGVNNGTTNITATSGAITSNKVVVLVGGGNVPFLISFASDTISVGRGATTPIPVLLSRPAAAPLTVNLASPVFAHWQSASVVIPQGQTSVNATLVGDSAGSTTVTASDGSGLGYSSATATARVTANMRLTNGGYAINTTDIVTTQVLLSDPSPAGGTYVTFNYSVAGVAAVSPDPAFIPAGQLAADIQIRAVGAGSTNITPNAIGVNGTASSFTAYAPTLTSAYTFLLLGNGQSESYLYVQVPTYTNTPIPVTLVNSDSTVASVPASMTINAGQYYNYYPVAAKATGTAIITYSSPGWTAPNSLTVRVSTPLVAACCSYSLFTTSPVQTGYATTEDSARTSHTRTSSLVVRVASSDTTIMKVLDTLVTVGPGQAQTSFRFQPSGGVGSAYLITSASGHTRDSVKVTVQGPPLSFYYPQWTLGAGQEEPNFFLQVPNAPANPLNVAVSSTDSTILAVPAQVTIPINSYYTYMLARGKAPGGVTVNATATGYQPASTSYIVTSPRVVACCNYTFNNFSSGSNIVVYSADSLRNTHNRSTPLSVAVASSDTNVIKIDSSTVTIPAGQYYNNLAHVTPVGVGTARITFQAAGHLSLDTLTITVQTPKIQFSFFSTQLGRRQHFGPFDADVQLPNAPPSPVAITITNKSAIDSVPTVLTIPTNTYYQYLQAYALSNGVDTLIASAPGYISDTAFIVVGTPHLQTFGGLPSTTTTTNPPVLLPVYATDSLNNNHETSDTVVVHAVSTDSNVIRPIHPFMRIPKDAYYAYDTVTILGPGSAAIIFSDSAGVYRPDTTNTVTVTGPSFTLYSSSSVLGMRQTDGPFSSFVYIANTIGTDLVVNLLSTSTRVATVPATVTIPAGQHYGYFGVTSQDTVGTIQIQASATGYTTVTTNVQVTQPKFIVSTATNLATTSFATPLYVYAADANGSTHQTTENVTVTLASSAPGVAAIDSSTVQIDSGTYYSNTAMWAPGTVGTSQLSASDSRAAQYRYNSGVENVSVTVPSLSIGTQGTIGLGQYDDYQSVSSSVYTRIPVPVTLSHVGAARTQIFQNLTSTPITGLQIDSATYYQYFRHAGSVVGTDTLVASSSSPAYSPDTAITAVTLGRLDPSSFPSTLKNGDSVLVYIYARDANLNTHYQLAAATINLSGTNVEFRSGGSTSTVITSVQIPADAYYVYFWIKATAVGQASVSFSNANYTTYTNSVPITP